MRTVLILSCVFLLHTTYAWFYGRPDPGYSSHGEVWPLPQEIKWVKFNHTLDPANFQFNVADGSDSDVLRSAIRKYKKWTFPDYNSATGGPTVTPSLLRLSITVKNNSADKVPHPQMDMDESYTLTIASDNVAAILEANQVWGALRGLDTFSQLVWQPISNFYQLRAVSINDFPRFKHRGIMLDTSRHFFSIPILKRNLDLMAQNKMNVFHWHIVDSEAFPYTSAKYPELTKGAYSSAHVYTVNDMKEIVEYARLRGIRVIAEFDTPGHTGGWEKGFPGLLSKCYYDNGNENVWRDIIDPSKDANWDFLKNFFEEAINLFPDNYMHFGGDEVEELMQWCWKNNPEVLSWMKSKGFGEDVYKVLNWYWNKLVAMIQTAKADAKMVVWQEVLDSNVQAPDTIAHVWKGNNYDEIMEEMALVTKNGHPTILSSCWYLNYIKYGPDWGYIENNNDIQLRGLYYQCDPTDFNGTQAQKDLVIGGEAAMWAEYVDGASLIPRLWPRASAVAERLWSNKGSLPSNGDDAWPRLHEHRCRMVRRGYPAQPPNNPDYCPTFWDPQYDDIP